MSSGSAIAFEVMKALRERTMTRHALYRELGGDWWAIARAVEEGVRNGVLVEVVRSKTRFYRVSSQWGGSA